MDRITIFKLIAIFLSIGITLISVFSQLSEENIAQRYLEEDISAEEKLKQQLSDIEKEIMVNVTEFEKYVAEHQKTLIDQYNMKEKAKKFYRVVDKVTFKGKYWIKPAENLPNVSSNNSSDFDENLTNLQKNKRNNFSYLSNRTEGDLAFRIERMNTYSLINEKVLISMRLLDGHYIDKWILIRSFNSPYNATISDKSFMQMLTTYINHGEIFELKDEEMTVDNYCLSALNLNWAKPKGGNNNTHNVSNFFDDDTLSLSLDDIFTGYFASNCGIPNFSFQLEFEDPKADFPKILHYSAFITILAASQIFNTMWLMYKMGESSTIGKSISLITVLQNIIWNAYGCLSHFFLTVNFDYYSSYFGLPAMLYFANFSIFELKLLYNLWRIKNTRYMNDPLILRRKLIQFYFMFYFIMFFSLFYVLKFYFDPPYIYFALIFTWLPQIIFNAIYKNKMSMPLINIVLTSLNKMFIPFYSRGCPENLFQIKSNSTFINICVLSIILEIFFLYSQTVFGPRWFIPKWFRCSARDSADFDFYKTKAEVLAASPNAENHDCVICLSPLMGNASASNHTSDFIAIPVGGEAQGYDYNVQKESYCRKIRIVNCFKLLKKFSYYLIEFHEFESSLNKKPFMLTPCKHCFHTPCLESWFKLKKECPSCRKDIDL